MASSSSCELLHEESERESLQKPFIKSNTKKLNYGSLRKENQPTVSKPFIINYKHKLQSGETLQGISLKYGVPIEAVKRANRLWSNDLASFVKDNLIIPLDKEKIEQLGLVVDTLEKSQSYENNNKQNQNDSILSNKINNVNDEHKNMSNLENNQNSNNNNNKNIANGNGKPDEDKFKDYLNKFDTFLSESKLKLKTLEINSKNTTEGLKSSSSTTLKYNNSDNSLGKKANLKKNSTIDNSSSYTNRNYDLVHQNSSDEDEECETHSTKLSHNRSATSEQSSTSPELVITSPNRYLNYYSSNHNLINSTTVNNNRAKFAHENLQRLEKEKDDLYEL